MTTAKHGSKENSPLYRASVVTVSDSCARGQREDLSGPECARILAEAGFAVAAVRVVPDGEAELAPLLRELCDSGENDLVITTGGTGLAPRDRTPEATRAVLEREAPGLAELLRAEGRARTPMAALTRGLAGTRGRTLVVNLPGSVKAVREGLETLLPILPHALETLGGNVSRCGG